MKKFKLQLAALGISMGLGQFAQSMEIQSIGQIADGEAFAKTSIGYMSNAIQHHLCLQKPDVIADILRTYTNDGPFLEKNERRFTLDDVQSVLNQYTRDQIVAAEVVALSNMTPRNYVGGRAQEWLDNVNSAQKSGDVALEGALLAVSPGIVFDTFAEIAFAGPTYLANKLFNAMDKVHCTPVADTEEK